MTNETQQTGGAPESTTVASNRGASLAAQRLTLIYAAFAALWIVASDHAALHLAGSDGSYLTVSIVKGMAFILVTAMLLYGLVYRAVSQQEAETARVRQREADAARMSRLYSALSEVNRAILWTRSREALYTEVCRALVEQGGLRMAWIGREAEGAKRLVAMTSHGFGSDLPAVVTLATEPSEWGDSEAGEAFQRGRPSIRNHLLDDVRSVPWREALRERGFAASAAFPIRDGSEVAAVLVVHTDVPGFFQDLEVELLQRATTNITYAVDNFRREERRLAAEQRAHAEHEFAQVLLESMPGVIFLYDESRRIIRWNRELERQSGFSAREIAGMDALDFFTSEGRERVRAAIERVFAGEESNVVARLQSADGGVRRYRLASRRVEMGGRPFVLGQGIESVPDAPEFDILQADSPPKGDTGPT